jgi:hypothetical protein
MLTLTCIICAAPGIKCFNLSDIDFAVLTFVGVIPAKEKRE